MELLSKANFSTNHKHRPGCRKQRAGRHYQVVSVKSKKWRGKSVPCSLRVCWSLVSLPSLILPPAAWKSAMPSQPFKYQEIRVEGEFSTTHHQRWLRCHNQNLLSHLLMFKAKWRLIEADVMGSWSRLVTTDERVFVCLNGTLPFARRLAVSPVPRGRC